MQGEDQVWQCPVKWGELRDIVAGLETLARGQDYDGPQADWARKIWAIIMAAPVNMAKPAVSPQTVDQSRSEAEKPKKGSAKDRLTALDAFTEKQEEEA